MTARAWIAVVALCVQTGCTQGYQAWIQCLERNNQATTRISACTTVIQSGHETRDNLAVAFSQRGAAHWEQREYDRALQDWDQALRLNPDLADAFYKRGTAYLAMGDDDRAIQDFDQAIRLKPNFAVFTNRGNAYGEKGEHDRAIEDYDQALRLKPGLAEALYGRCWSRALANKTLEEALSDCNEYRKLRPNDPRTFHFRGLVYFRMNRYAEAIADLDRRLSSQPESADSLYVRGLAKRMRHDAVSGDADIVAAKKIDPKIAETYAGYGVRP